MLFYQTLKVVVFLLQCPDRVRTSVRSGKDGLPAHPLLRLKQGAKPFLAADIANRTDAYVLLHFNSLVHFWRFDVPWLSFYNLEDYIVAFRKLKVGVEIAFI